MAIKKEKIKKILFVTLSNIGDCILTLPVLDALRREFPESLIDVVVGPRPEEIFKDNPTINQVVIYAKHSRLKDKLNLIKNLKRQHYDLVIDLRNSAFPLLINAKYKTTPFTRINKDIMHMKDRHLNRLKSLINCDITDIMHSSLWINPDDEAYIDGILKANKITNDRLVVISPGARSHIKRWQSEGFVQLIDSLVSDYNVGIVLAGDEEDRKISSEIVKLSKHNLADLTGKTTLKQLAALLKRSSLLISNDSAVMHLGSYLNIPVAAIFGPTNSDKYGPWSDKNIIVQKRLVCSPCQKAQCKFDTLQCMKDIKAEEVSYAASKLLNTSQDHNLTTLYPHKKYNRILIIRTDRIGDVVLTTPMIKAIRDAWPTSYIAMMVSPAVVDVVKGNPYLDEVVVYDKNNLHRGLRGGLKFISELRKKKFNLAIVMHTKSRINIITYLAGIRERVGYHNKKFSFLLTKKLIDTRPQGLKHESEYCLDILRNLGIEPKDKELFMPVRKSDEVWADNVLSENGISEKDLLVGIHPGASCPSKRWPVERFAEISNVLLKKYKAKIILLGSEESIPMVEEISKAMQDKAVNLAGKITISQLASVLRRCRIFISNDSGPVHVSVAVGTPVVAIYSRNQPGISPARWGLLGENNVILHKDVGCEICHAHDCKIGFACLKAITIPEVLEAIDKILES